MWLRIILFGFLIYLVIRLINQFVSGLTGKKKDDNEPGPKERKVSKDVGEYVDYEDVD